MPEKCANCGHDASYECGECKTVYYCSNECQGTHYNEHKSQCISAPLIGTASDYTYYTDPYNEDARVAKRQHTVTLVRENVSLEDQVMRKIEYSVYGVLEGEHDTEVAEIVADKLPDAVQFYGVYTPKHRLHPELESERVHIAIEAAHYAVDQNILQNSVRDYFLNNEAGVEVETSPNQLVRDRVLADGASSALVWVIAESSMWHIFCSKCGYLSGNISWKRCQGTRAYTHDKTF